MNLELCSKCVDFLQPLPKCDSAKTAQGENLLPLLHAVSLVEWRPDGYCIGMGDRSRAHKRFWASLRLHLPPYRHSRQTLSPKQVSIFSCYCCFPYFITKGRIMVSAHSCIFLSHSNLQFFLYISLKLDVNVRLEPISSLSSLNFCK